MQAPEVIPDIVLLFLLNRIVGGVADQPGGTVDAAHHTITGVNAESAGNTTYLLPFADIHVG